MWTPIVVRSVRSDASHHAVAPSRLALSSDTVNSISSTSIDVHSKLVAFSHLVSTGNRHVMVQRAVCDRSVETYVANMILVKISLQRVGHVDTVIAPAIFVEAVGRAEEVEEKMRGRSGCR